MFPFRRFRVEDESMRPTLGPGDYVLVNRWTYRLRRPAKGDLVVFQDSERLDRFLVKRIDDVLGPGLVSVASDNPDRGRDSRTFGPIRADRIVGKVWLRLKP